MLLRILKIAILLSLLSPGGARADCFGTTAPFARDIDTLAFGDPMRALAQIHSVLHDSSGTAALTDDQRATLHTIAAEAYRQLGRSVEALAEANRASQLLRQPSAAPLALRLRAITAMATSLNGDTEGALRQLDGAIADAAADQRAVACLRADRGWLRYRSGDYEGALRDLIMAYQALKATGPQNAAMVAAGRLASVYGSAREYQQAMSLLNETIDYFGQIGARIRLATARGRLGDVRREQGDLEAARREYTEVGRLSALANDLLGVGYADLAICDIEIRRAAFNAAQRACAEAGRAIRAAGPVDTIDRKILAAYGARIALGKGNAASAVRGFDQALADNPTDVDHELLTKIYLWRSAARAALSRYQGAYADAQEYQRHQLRIDNANSANATALLRVRFGIDQEMARSEQLRRERSALLEQSRRERLQRNLVLVAATLLLAATVFIAWAVQRRRIAEIARRATEKQFEELSQLTAGIAHDFNNLMTVVQQAAGLLLRHASVRGDADAVELVQATCGAAESGTAITKQLLAFGRQQALRPESVVLNAYLAAQRGLLQQAAGPEVELRIESELPGLVARVDAAQLTNALVNLVANAVDAMGRHGPLTIRTSRSTPPDATAAPMVAIAVEDHGSGMTADVLSHATEPFFSTKGPGAGSGLGLSAVAGFVRQSGGQLQIRSERNSGTTVTLWLPAA